MKSLNSNQFHLILFLILNVYIANAINIAANASIAYEVQEPAERALNGKGMLKIK